MNTQDTAVLHPFSEWLMKNVGLKEAGKALDIIAKQACDLRDYFDEMAKNAQRRHAKFLADGDAEHAYALSFEIDAYAHARSMVEATYGLPEKK